MDNLFLLVFVTGLTGGFGHCLGMCGPVVVSCSVAASERKFLSHLLYNLGRVTTYTILGGVMGLTGSLIGFSGLLGGIQRAVMALAGLLIIVMGVGISGVFPLSRYIEGKAGVGRLVLKALNAFPRNVTPGTVYPMGVLLGFIPCGLVYTVLLSAVRAGMEGGDHAGGFLKGALMLLLFGLGTMPSLLVLGTAADKIGARMRRRFYTLSGLVVIVMGALFVLRAAGF
ncbi:MAG: sulfite exporter TauE/SafE family protein [Nitrospirae bacterium]|nr:sulfite exporter TauE/SafE family protein [Nitrospirota bacterium]